MVGSATANNVAESASGGQSIAPATTISDQGSFEDRCLEQLLQDMMAAYQEGDVYSWDPLPRIKELLDRIAVTLPLITG